MFDNWKPWRNPGLFYWIKTIRKKFCKSLGITKRVVYSNCQTIRTMNSQQHIYLTDCENYVSIEGDFVNIFYNISDFMTVLEKLNDEQFADYPDTFAFLSQQDRYDILCEGRDFFNLKPAKIEIA